MTAQPSLFDATAPDTLHVFGEANARHFVDTVRVVARQLAEFSSDDVEGLLNAYTLNALALHPSASPLLLTWMCKRGEIELTGERVKSRKRSRRGAKISTYRRKA